MGSGPVSENRRGSHVVQSALSFGVLMLLVLSIFDLGRVAYAYSDISQAAREAARYAAAHPGDVIGTRRVALAWSALDLDLTDVDVAFTTERPTTVRVTIRYRYHAACLLAVQLTGGDSSITLIGESRMTTE